MKTYQLFLLSILSGILLAFSWFPVGFYPLLFIAFIPLLIIENTLFQNQQKYNKLTLFVCSYLAFFIWNILVTWWVKNASFGGAAMAILANALLMTFVIMFFHRIKKRVGSKWANVLFICFWIAFEFIHLRWDLSWPWLTLGNAFADSPNIIQWYEYTGVFGGSLWILFVNVLVFEFLSGYKYQNFREKSRSIIIILSAILLPVIISYAVLSTYKKSTENEIQVVIVQPNIDPYNEKFFENFETQLQKMIALAKQKTDSTTDYLILPETALTENIWENEINQSISIKKLQDYLKQFPNLKIIIGACTIKAYKKGETLSATARKFTDENGYYDSYNTALQLDNSDNIQIYHKSKLVPGVEKMPFPSVFKYFEKFAIELGGTSGSLGMQDERTVFVSPNKKIKVAPVVCYESIYGEYVGEYMKNGANFITIITNDGWWGDTPGYKQHLKFGALRAIETRKWIARSANTGITCFIDPFGEIQQPTKWWVPAVISQKMYFNSEFTFYTKYGDYIGRAALYITIAMLIYSLLIRLKIAKKQ